jgi:hypothetical protein
MRVLITSMAAVGLVGLAIGTAWLENEPTIDKVRTGSIELRGDRPVGKKQTTQISGEWSSWKFRNAENVLSEPAR